MPIYHVFMYLYVIGIRPLNSRCRSPAGFEAQKDHTPRSWLRFNERDPAVKMLLAMAISAAKKAGKYIGICG